MTARVMLHCYNVVMRDMFVSKMRQSLDTVDLRILNSPFDRIEDDEQVDYIVVNDADSNESVTQGHIVWLHNWLHRHPYTKAFVRTSINFQINRQLSHPTQLTIVQSDFGFCHILPEFIAMDWHYQLRLKEC